MIHEHVPTVRLLLYLIIPSVKQYPTCYQRLNMKLNLFCMPIVRKISLIHYPQGTSSKLYLLGSVPRLQQQSVVTTCGFCLQGCDGPPTVQVYVASQSGLGTCYSAAYISQTRDQQRFTISEVAADWHEPMWPSIARANGQLDPRCSQQTHRCPNQPDQAFTPQPQLLHISRPAEGRRLSWPAYTVGQQLAQGCLQRTGCESNPQPLGCESDTLPLDHCTHVRPCFLGPTGQRLASLVLADVLVALYIA